MLQSKKNNKDNKDKDTNNNNNKSKIKLPKSLIYRQSNISKRKLRKVQCSQCGEEIISVITTKRAKCERCIHLTKNAKKPLQTIEIEEDNRTRY